MSTITDDRDGKPSASSMARIHFCSGSESLIRSIPETERIKEPNEVSLSGDRIHLALQKEDLEELDMSEAEVAEQLSRLETEVFEQWRNDVLIPAGLGDEMSTVVREERLWLIDDKTNNLVSSKPDVVYIVASYALVIDYKSGYKIVTPAQRNHQLKTQALTVWSTYGITNIRVAVAQHRFTSMKTAADYNEALLINAEGEVRFDIWRSEQPDAPRNPGTWCDYCPAKNHCREAGVYATMPLVVAMNSAPAGLAKEEIIAAVERLQPADLKFIWKRASVIEKIVDAVKSRIRSLPTDQLAGLGLSIDDGRAQSEVRDPVAYIKWLTAEGLIEESEVMGLFELVNGRLEKLVLPRLVQRKKEGGIKSTQDKEKTELRKMVTERGWINYEASRTAGQIKEIAP